jgi:hypothetical protein
MATLWMQRVLVSVQRGRSAVGLRGNCRTEREGMGRSARGIGARSLRSGACSPQSSGKLTPSLVAFGWDDPHQ